MGVLYYRDPGTGEYKPLGGGGGGGSEEVWVGPEEPFQNEDLWFDTDEEGAPPYDWTDADARYETKGSVAAHEGATNPHPNYATDVDVAGKVSKSGDSMNNHLDFPDVLHGVSFSSYNRALRVRSTDGHIASVEHGSGALYPMSAGEPVNPQSVATRNYVDSNLASNYGYWGGAVNAPAGVWHNWVINVSPNLAAGMYIAILSVFAANNNNAAGGHYWTAGVTGGGDIQNLGGAPFAVWGLDTVIQRVGFYQHPGGVVQLGVHAGFSNGTCTGTAYLTVCRVAK